MDGDAFSERILEMKRQRVKEIVYLVCDKEKLPIPKINFKGCPVEKQNELAHYHPDENKICISELQLHKLRSLVEVENTTYHELAHILELNHGGKFIKTKNKFRLDTWRPPRGAIFISAEVQKELDELRVHQKPEKIEVDKTFCNYHLCKKKRKLYQCPHCKGYFCEEHIQPIVPAHLTSEWSTSDSSGTNYHPCPEYVVFKKKQEEQKIEDYGKALDRLSGRRISLKYEDTMADSRSEKNASKTGGKREPKVRATKKLNLEKTREKLGIDVNDRSHIKSKSEYKTQKIEEASYKKPPNKKDDLETVRTKLGIDLDERAHIESKKRKGILDTIREIFGLD